MITWREEGERGRDHRYVALLGEVEVGHVEWSGSGHWSWRSDLPPASKSGYHEKRDAAKAALAEAVGEWVERAGLAHPPAGHVVVKATDLEHGRDPCPFSRDDWDIEPHEPCPVCGDLGTLTSDVSRCVSRPKPKDSPLPTPPARI